MQRRLERTLVVVTALAALAGSAQAQGKGHGNGHRDRDRDRDRHGDRHGTIITRRSGGEVEPGWRRRVPPGLANKPGQMPPGQYKKLYGTRDGAWVLSDVLRRRGYTVTRLMTDGDSRVVYYRAADGTIRRAIVSPGTDRLGFSNVPASILQEVLSRLY